MITHRISDYRYDLDLEWSAEVFCEIVRSLWRQMQEEHLVPANYRLHLPATAEGMQDLIIALQQLDERLHAGIPKRMRLPGLIFSRMRDGTYILNSPLILEIMVAAWSGLGQRPVHGQYSVYGWSQRSNDLVWFLNNYEKIHETLVNRVGVEYFPRMLSVALSEICPPRGFVLRV